MLRTAMRIAAAVVLGLAVWKITGGDIGGLLSNLLDFILHLADIASDWVVDIWNTVSS